ncbi:MAG: MATE family efflux transporter [Senegalia sp. (in: firmicutes)]|uniref:MATE family efflux transporter n=1 Tax=Senegalia sp. (in: firmicutes) TaxID=1924098 RepID=UPI003F94D63A
MKIKKYWLKKIIVVGVPSSIGQSTTSLGFAVLNIFVKSFGSATLTAFIIGNRINSLILMPAMGIGSALATVVGQNLGKDDVLRARKAVKTSAALATIFLIIGGTFVFILAPQIISLFTNSKDVIEQSVFYLRVISASLPLMGIFQVFNGTFQGSGHTIMAMLVMSSRLWVFRIPMIILFKNYTNLGEKSVWFAMILSNGFVCLIGFILYLSRKWETKIIKKELV